MSNQLFLISVGATLAILIVIADFMTIGLLGAEWIDRVFGFGTGGFVVLVLEESLRRMKKFEDGGE